MLYQFHRFELDVDAFELRRDGRPVKLEKLPMELLVLLVTRAGQLLPREEIQKALWHEDVFVDVEPAINTAIRKIRRALGDDLLAPRFVATVVGKGYRFVAPVASLASRPVVKPTETAALEPLHREASNARATGREEGEADSASSRRPGWAAAMHGRSARRFAATAGIALTAGFAVWSGLRATPQPDLIQFSISHPAGQPFVFPLMGLSSDGRRLAFADGETLDTRMVKVRAFDSLTTTTMPGSERARTPFWSPDGRFIAFTTTDRKLKRIDVSTGAVVTLVAENVGVGGAWSPAGLIAFDRGGGPLFQVAAEGGRASPLTTLDPSRKETWHAWPLFLADGRRFIFTAESSDPMLGGIYLATVGSTERTRLVDVASNTGLGAGYLVYYRGRSLVAQRFDETIGRVAGDPVPIVEQVEYTPEAKRADFAVSRGGVLAYRSGAEARSNLLTWIDKRGTVVGTVAEQGSNKYPRLSPDRRQIVFSRGDIGPSNYASYDLWLFDLERHVPKRLTFDRGRDFWPSVWSPDGRKLAFAMARPASDSADLYQRSSDGQGTNELLYASTQEKYPTGFSPDAKTLLFSANDSQTGWDVWALPMSGDRQPYPVIQTPYNETCAAFSPDGRWITYTSDESGSVEVYIQPFPPTGVSVRLSTSGGAGPMWLANGARVAFSAVGDRFMAVDVTTSAGVLRPSAPYELFKRRHIHSPCGHFTADSSGDQFLIAAQPDESTETPINVIVNWPAMLRAR